jgi:hypothetical protein
MRRYHPRYPRLVAAGCEAFTSLTSDSCEVRWSSCLSSSATRSGMGSRKRSASRRALRSPVKRMLGVAIGAADQRKDFAGARHSPVRGLDDVAAHAEIAKVALAAKSTIHLRGPAAVARPMARRPVPESSMPGWSGSDCSCTQGQRKAVDSPRYGNPDGSG